MRRPRVPRMGDIGLYALILLAAIGLIAPQQLPVILFKLSLVLVAGFLGYWLDRRLFPYARPHEHFGERTRVVGAMLMLRRAVIVVGAMLAVGLGL